jgi:hypothetical protein
VESGVAPLTLLFNEVKEQQAKVRADRGVPYHEPVRVPNEFKGENGKLPGFPDAKWEGRKYDRYRWKLPDGKTLEWDSRHGELEMYKKNGKKHLGSFDPYTGNKLKGLDKTKTVKP